MSSDAKTYIKDVLALLEIPSKSQKEVQSVLEASIAEHGLEEASYNTIAEELGEPQAQAAVYAEHFAAFDRLIERKHRQFVRTVLATIVAIVAVLAIWLATLATMNYFERRDFRNGYFVETIYEVPAMESTIQTGE